MYETYYGFSEKPFSLAPDPKYLYRSQSHGSAFDLLQHAARRREGLVVVTGGIGTGKTTLCRALREQIDRTIVTALVPNPFLTEEDLLTGILQDFGVISRDRMHAARVAGVTRQELIEALHEFLLSLIPLKASALLIIDDAHNLPLRVFEQIRILSNLGSDNEKLLQIVLIGQLDLQTLLRAPEMRQVDQRVSIRYELKPLDCETVGAYVAHRLTIAGGGAAVTFSARALEQLHRRSGGIPRLINRICDRALLAAFSIRADRITFQMVTRAANSLDVQMPDDRRWPWVRRQGSLLVGAAVVLLSSAVAVGVSAYAYQRFAAAEQAAARPAARAAAPETAGAAVPSLPAAAPVQQLTPVDADRELPADAAFTILVGSFPVGGDTTAPDVRAMTDWLEASGFRVFHADVNLGSRGRWRRVLAGAYADSQTARREAERLRTAAPQSGAHLVSAGFAIGIVAAARREPDGELRPSGTEP